MTKMLRDEYRAIEQHRSKTVKKLAKKKQAEVAEILENEFDPYSEANKELDRHLTSA
jgi:hypothetical protein